MNILFVVPYVPNLLRARSYNLVRFLALTGHNVTVLSLYETETEREDAERLADICGTVHSLPLSRVRSLWNSLLAVPSEAPLQAAYSWQPALAIRMQEMLTGANNGSRSFDVIHVEHLRGVRYALFAEQSAAHNRSLIPPIIWDSVDSISMLFRETAAMSQKRTGRIITRFELGRTEKYEAWLAKQFAQILLTSPRDKEAYLSLLDPADAAELETHFSVLPNGVDLDYFRPTPSIERHPATIVVHGKMSYHANVTMVLHLVANIMPKIWEERPDARLVIVGKDPGKEIRALGERDRIEVTGTVDDIRPYLQRAAVTIAPVTYGAGIQNKVLEAMACAAPVVASPTAVSALQALPGRDLLVARDPAEFAGYVLDLIADPERGRTLGANGRRFVETNHDWFQIVRQLEVIYQRAIDRSQIGVEG